MMQLIHVVLKVAGAPEAFAAGLAMTTIEASKHWPRRTARTAGTSRNKSTSSSGCA